MVITTRSRRPPPRVSGEQLRVTDSLLVSAEARLSASAAGRSMEARETTHRRANHGFRSPGPKHGAAGRRRVFAACSNG